MMSSNVLMTGFAYDLEGISVEAAWLFVNKNPRPPDATIPPLSPQKQLVVWAGQQIADVGITDRCYISLSCVGRLPWFEFSLPAGPHGLALYWSGLLVKSVLIFGHETILNLHAGEKWLAARYYALDALKGPRDGSRENPS
jgi:hypothetical protein